ncbi:hypothetical protein ACS0TY_020427 [Phlomoides rotata]
MFAYLMGEAAVAVACFPAVVIAVTHLPAQPISVVASPSLAHRHRGVAQSSPSSSRRRPAQPSCTNEDSHYLFSSASPKSNDGQYCKKFTMAFVAIILEGTRLHSRPSDKATTG